MNGCGESALRTERVVLRPTSVELMRAVLAADWAAAERELGVPFPPEWRGDGWQWLEPRLAEGERDASLLAWGTRLARADEDSRIVAECGFHGPPDESGWVEIGYRVVAADRRRGFALEAVTALLDWAWQHGVAGVRASVAPDNAASLALVRRLGFVEGELLQHPVLGELVTFRLVRPDSAGRRRRPGRLR